MGTFATIADVSGELRRQIFEALQDTPDTDFGLSDSIDRITLQPASDQLPSSVVASLYLYHLEISPHRRSQAPLPDPARDDEFHRPPLPLQLRYLFTPVDDEEATNQLLLGRVLQHFHDHPCFATLSGTPIGDSLGGASAELRVRHDPLSLEQLSQIWNAFSFPYRVALGLLVEVVAVDSGLPATLRPRVREMVGVTGQVAP